MKLRWPCEHKDDQHPEGRYEPHWGPCRFEECQGEPDHVKCPGGVFLQNWIADTDVYGLADLLDALFVREADLEGDLHGRD